MTVNEHGITPNKYNPHAWIINDPEIGEGTWIGAFTVIDGIGGLKIGKGCDISCGVHIITHSTVKRCVTERKYNDVEKSETVIEDHVFIGPCAVLTNDKYPIRNKSELKGPILRKGASIGANSTILPGVEIGEGAMVAAGALVTRDVPDWKLAIGFPAKFKDIPEDLKTLNNI